MNANYDECSRKSIIEYMGKLRLKGMIESYDEIIADAVKRNAPSTYLLQELLKVEIKNKTIRSITNRMKLANFPQKHDLDNFIFSDTPINQEEIMNLYGGDFIKTARNIVFIGGTGTGKTHLAISIGSRSVRRGYKVRFFNLVDLVNCLEW